ncbi:MAG TPA: Arc family DNA-binding protein [Armatimonadota bacterium]|nr:Arc family DNA-binding protein [Armatimonadota bacterium]
MASITIRDIPDELFERFKELAREQRRSINAEVIAVMEQAVRHLDLREQRLRALEEIARIRESQQPTKEADTLKILREGRRR